MDVRILFVLTTALLFIIPNGPGVEAGLFGTLLDMMPIGKTLHKAGTFIKYELQKHMGSKKAKKQKSSSGSGGSSGSEGSSEEVGEPWDELENLG